MDADIVTGEGQSPGLPLDFGGPYLGIIATRKNSSAPCPDALSAKRPTRTVNAVSSTRSRPGTAHPPREATSNICTNVSLCAIQSVIYMSLLGKEGLQGTGPTKSGQGRIHPARNRKDPRRRSNVPRRPLTNLRSSYPKTLRWSLRP